MAWTAQETYQKLLGRGLNPVAAAALTGNLKAESSYNPLAFNSAGGGQGALGLFQWRGPRQTGLKNFASTRNTSFNDGDLQLDYLIDELTNQPEHAGMTLAELNAFTDPVDAAVAFRQRYLRPGEDPGGYATTRATSVDVYNQFSGLEPIMPPTEREKPLLTFGGAVAAAADATSAAAVEKYGGDMRYMQLLMQGLVPGQYNDMLLSFGKLAEETAPASLDPYPTGTVPPTVATSDATAAPMPASAIPNEVKKPGALDWLIPARNSEEEGQPFYKRPGFSDALTALSTGLGQMSAGETVNLSPAVNDLRRVRQERLNSEFAQQQAVVEAEQTAQTDALNAQISQQNADTSSLNTQLAQERLELERQQYAAERDKIIMENAPLSPTMLDAMRAVPQLAPAVEAYTAGMASGAPPIDLGKQLTNAYGKHLETVNEAGTNVPLSPAAMTVLSAGMSPTADPTEVALQTGQLDANEAKRVNDLIRDYKADEKAAAEGGNTSTTWADANELYNEDQALPEDQRRFASPGDAYTYVKGLETDPAVTTAELETARQLHYIKASDTEVLKRIDRRKADRDMMATIDSAEQLVDELAAAGIETGEATNLATRAIQMVGSLAGPEIASEIEAWAGIPAGTIKSLDSRKQAIALLMGRAMLQGQGSVTDDERKRVMSAFVSSDMGLAETTTALAQMKASITLERMADDAFIKLSQKDPANYIANAETVDNLYLARKSDLTRAYSNAALYNLSQKTSADGSSPNVALYKGKSTQQILDLATPKFTNKEEAALFDQFVLMEVPVTLASGATITTRAYYNEEQGEYYGIADDGTQYALDF